MLSRERVAAVIDHKKPDRIPIYGWLRANLQEQLTESFGSVEAFEDKYEFDLAHLFSGFRTFPKGSLDTYAEELGRDIEPKDLMEKEMSDPDDESAYEDLKEQIRLYKEEKGRFVYVQTPGIFEALNGAFKIENHLCYLALYEKDLHDVYRRQAEWNRRFAENCIELGVDMVHVSDDWGAQNNLMFSPETWWKLIYPYHKITCDAVKKRGAYLSLHSDGNVSAVIDGVIKLGYDVVHPYQESAGMDLGVFKEKYRDAFTVLGGLDVQTTLGFGKYDKLKADIDRVMRMFADGGLLYCTTHFVQSHCSIKELTFAYDHIYEMARGVCRKSVT